MFISTCLVIDGVYAATEDGSPEFHQLPVPEDEEVLRLTMLVSQRVQALLKRRGLRTEAYPQYQDLSLTQRSPGPSIK
jgi:hypothetical protein